MFRAIALLLNPAGHLGANRPGAARGVFHFVRSPGAAAGSHARGGGLRAGPGLGSRGGCSAKRRPHCARWRPDVAVRYAAAAAVLYTAAILLSARVAQTLGNSFQSTHNYRQALATVAYGLSPYFLCRMLDGLPGVNTWFAFGLGVLLTIPAFYPRGSPGDETPTRPARLAFFCRSRCSAGWGWGSFIFWR